MSDDLRVQLELQGRLVAVASELGKILATHANAVMKMEPKPSDRFALLFAAVAKIKETSGAVLHLAHISAVDEMNVLLRPMVEVIVNACYLQHATDEEIQRYLHFDPINSHVAMTDLVSASKGKLRVPADLEARTQKHADAAHAASKLPLGSRMWSLGGSNLKKRAVAVDNAVGDEDMAGMLATVYVTGSGYVHGTYKTLHKHARYLLQGQTEHPHHVLHGVNNAIHGVGYVQLVFARYFARRFGISNERLNALAAESVRLTTMLHEDYKLFRDSVRRAQRQG